ncbi:hypothetical protein AK830_g7713 [Neonectria ditissima]|uniref:Uncharacterized protein n=1 Tax=Neonectria ditissima TaxID=78410 RepID=A0A0P7BE64_9HYPO|nr:hypothetical protein AK830_g7713 [Neonectria ditissima]
MRFRTVEDPAQVPLAEVDGLISLRDTMPGRPSISLDDQVAVGDFLRAELSTTRLKRMYPLLFLTSNRENISQLHHQAVMGRDICTTERPDLHLLWHYSRIFIKPVPQCLLSYSFWEKHLSRAKDEDGDELSLEAMGFLRTYSRLIVHESDFHLAERLGLLPRGVTWEGWNHFIRGFRPLRDRNLAPRYHYGEIRLTRLNIWHTVLYGTSYQKIYHNYATIFGGFGPLYLFVFGASTVLLTALQTGLDAHPDGSMYQNLASRFVPFTLVLTMIGLGFLPLLFMFYQFRELLRFIFCHRELS